MKLRRIFSSPFTPLYDEAGLTQKLRRGLMFVILGNLGGNLFFNMTQGSALVGYAAQLGANDFVFGVLVAIPLFGTLAQLPAAMIVSKAGKRKIFMLTYGVVSRAMWILVGIVPYVVPLNPGWLKLWSVIFLVGISSIGGSFINICFTPWLADLVPLRIRGRWISCRDRIISIIGVCAGILMALVLDFLPGFTGYSIVFIFGGVVGVLDMLAFISVEDTPVISNASRRIGPVLKRVRHDKKFFSFMVFWTAWAFSTNFGGAFIGRYALGPLNLSFLEVTLAGQVAAALITVFVISKWGRVIDRYGSKPIMFISCMMTALMPTVMLFSRPDNVITFLIFNLVGAAFWSAANLACVNMQMSCSPDDQRPAYIAVFACVTSLFGSSLGVFLGGAFLEWLPGFMEWADVTIRGSRPDQYKVLFFVSVLMRITAVLVFVPKLINDNDATLKDLVSAFKERLTDYSPRRIYKWIRYRR